MVSLNLTIGDGSEPRGVATKTDELDWNCLLL
jgi:hypothetical protein